MSRRRSGRVWLKIVLICLGLGVVTLGVLGLLAYAALGACFDALRKI